MVQEISEIKELVKGLDKKLDNVMECKADKSEVDTLWKKYESLNDWKWKVIGIGLVGGGVLVFLAVELFKHLTQ